MLQKCCLCKLPIKGKERSVVIKGKHGKSLKVCSNCQDDVYLDGIRFNKDVMIVPVKRESLNIACTRKLYICPSAYVARNPKMIAFYIGGKVGAITHIGCMKSIETNVVRKDILPTSNKEAIFPRWKRFERYKVFHLENVIELERPIRRGDVRGAVIQNRIYATFRRFLNARTVQDFYMKKMTGARARKRKITSK